MSKPLIFVVALLLGSSVWVGAAKPKPQPQPDQAQKDAGFRYETDQPAAARVRRDFLKSGSSKPPRSPNLASNENDT